MVSSPALAHTPTHHQDVLEKVQVAEGALGPVPQGSGAHLLADVRVEGCLLETERNVDISKQKELAGVWTRGWGQSPAQQCCRALNPRFWNPLCLTSVASEKPSLTPWIPLPPPPATPASIAASLRVCVLTFLVPWSQTKASDSGPSPLPSSFLSPSPIPSFIDM